MKKINNMTGHDISNIDTIIFDVDGVLVPRGTKITQVGNKTSFTTKKIPLKLSLDIKELVLLGYDIVISSGRGLYMLQEMFRDMLPYIKIIYENGSAVWSNGNVEVFTPDAFEYLYPLHMKLLKVKHKNIKGFEPKEFIITLHCTDRVPEVEKIAEKVDGIYCLWNGEAYDFGVENHQTKGEAVKDYFKSFDGKKENTMAIGDNYNDKELINEAGLKITADKTRLKGDFYIDLEGKKLPGQVLVSKILYLQKRKIK